MKLTSIAIQSFNMDSMEAFYREAFGFSFRDVAVGGMTCRFGQSGGLELKLVPMREASDFEGFPSHQPGFEVDDIGRIVEIAVRCGGRSMGEPVEGPDGRLHAGIRDPDGNTIELYRRDG